VLSFTEAVNETVPEALGVPVIFNVDPLGEATSVPLPRLADPLLTTTLLIVHVYAATPPVAVMDPE
jgi:hypothetical protein